MKKLFTFLLLVTICLSGLSCANVANTEGDLNSNSPYLEIHNSKDGVVISLPTKPDKANGYSIERKNITDNTINTISWGDYDNFNSTIIDNLVEPNKEYIYTLVYLQGDKEIFKSKPTPISDNNGKAQNGIGELQLDSNPVASYNENTGMFTFETAPDVIQSIKDSLFAHLSYCVVMVEFKKANGDSLLRFHANKQTNIANSINSKDFGEDFIFNNLEIYLHNNGLSYSRIIESDKLPGIQKTINIKDIRPTITAETSVNSNGVIISVDKSIIPENAVSINIGRIATKYPKHSSGDMLNNYIGNIDLDTTTSITDYFTTPNLEYTYTVIFFDKNFDIIIKSKPFTITALSGLGNGLTKNTSVRFDEKTNTSKITPKPNVDLSPIGGINNISLELSYRSTESGRLYSGKIDDTGLINWKFNFDDIKYKPLTLEKYSMELYSGNVMMYNLIVELDELEDYFDEESLKPITPKDIRPPLSLKNTTEGIIIDLPDSVMNAYRIEITRTNLTKNMTGTLKIDDIKNYKSTTITDRCVTPGDKYEYLLTAKDNHWNVFYQTKPTIIPTNDGKAKGGLGELILETIPKASFDQKKGIMTFETLPKLNKTIKESLTNKDSCKFYINYEDLSSGIGIFTEIKEIMDLTKYPYSVIFNENINFQSIDVVIIKDGVTYIYPVPSSVINTNPLSPNMPALINVKK